MFKIGVLIISLILISSNSFAFSEQMMFGDKSSSGIDPLDYDRLIEKLKAVQSRYSKFATVERVGESVRGREIIGVLIRNRDVTPRKLILVTGATHGNEYLNIEDSLVDQFLDKKNREFYDFYKRGGVFLVIPIFNPDGYSSWRRENANRRDLNRDFANRLINFEGFKEIETQNLSDYIERYTQREQVPLVLNMDYHCCYNGTLLFPWGFKKDAMPQVDVDRFSVFGELMQNHMPQNRYGKVSDFLWYTATGATLDYWYIEYGSISLTFEGNRGGEAHKLQAHVAWWKDIVKEFH